MSGQSSMNVADKNLICIMRHGTAEDRAPRDDMRELVEFGETQVEATARWYKKTLPNRSVDVAFVSPYIRARQTFDIFKKRITVGKTEIVKDITPEGDEKLVASFIHARIEQLSLTKQAPVTLLVVSHMPLVNLLVDEICPAVSSCIFNTASMAIIDYDTKVASGKVLQHFQSIF